jgi:phosphoglycerol transferase
MTQSHLSAFRVVGLPFIISAVACAVILCFVLRVDRLDLHVPLTYWGDALYFGSWVKGLIDGNWPWHNPRLGMPFGAEWRDFPVSLMIEAVAVRIFAKFTSSPGLVLNSLWLLATTACSGFATYSLQRLGVNKWVATSLGIIYALQPFTFYRGVSHFNLLFYLVPLLATGAIEIAAGLVFSTRGDGSSATPESSWARLTAVFRAIPPYLLLACLAQGFSYIYNAFFGVVLFAVAALVAFTVYRRKVKLFAASIAIVVTCGAALVNLAPTLVYWAKQGKNPAMAYKFPAEAETYGVKLRYLLTPIPDNPFPPLQYIQKKLDSAGFADQNESASSRLGLIGSGGLLFLLASALVSCLHKPLGDDPSTTVLGACSALALTCLLLGTVGGFGSFFNVFVAPDIRCYDRIIVFIDFFAVTAVGLLLTRAFAWFIRRNWPSPVFMAGLGLLVVFGVSDQALTGAYRNNGPRENEFKLDAAFEGSVEAAIPPNASVFQLPVTTFPMDGETFRIGPYDQSKPYLHSKTLRWSWGGITGREKGDWARRTSNLPVRDMLTNLSAAGFSGIWIDRFGYPTGTSPEREIREELGVAPLERPDGRIAFYDLRTKLKQRKTVEISRDVRLPEQHSVHPVEITFPAGFYAEEHNSRQAFRWCSRRGLIELRNTLPKFRSVKLDMTLQTGSAQQEPITISIGEQSERVGVTINSVSYSRKIQLPPGKTVSVSFDCECKPVNAPGDPRDLYFALASLRVVE